jgi:hypothetical protein
MRSLSCVCAVVRANQSKRDDIGIGGSWSDFLDYLKSSLSSGEVKLLFAADQLRKSPGMPPTCSIFPYYSLVIYMT